MIKIKLNLLLIAVVMNISVAVSAQNVTITQIDSSGLLASSTIDCYLNLTDAGGIPLMNADPSLIRMEHEKAEGMFPVKILDVKRNKAADTKITFLFVLDNSGSMYEKVGDGKKGTRMDHAERAVREFLKNIKIPGVRVGIAVFNTRYSLLVEPGKDIETISEALNKIKKPDSENSYTELYYSIHQAAKDISRYRGRKAIILLSDGENYPYFVMSGKPNPDSGKTVYLPEDALKPLRKEGTTLYGINFSSQKDTYLSAICINSGGTIYSALTSTELSNIYQKIQRRIAMEYRVTISAPLVFMETPRVRALYKGAEDTKTYYARSLMGAPVKDPLLFSVILFLLTLIIWVLLVMIRFEKSASRAEISMLNVGAGKPQQRTIALTSGKTVIGASPQADFTIAGIPDMKESHATIVKNENTGMFTVVSDREIKVNNRLTKKRDLKPGDVLNVEGATLVFDEPDNS